MANFVFNVAIQKIANKEIDLDTDVFFVSFHGATTTIDAQEDINVNSGFTTPNELSGTNYTAGGFQLTLSALDRNDTTDVIAMIADNLTINNLGPTATMKGVLVMWKASGAGQAWSTSVPVAWLDLAATPDGQDFTIKWNGNVSTGGPVIDMFSN